MGASVTLTRGADETFSLYQRTEAHRKAQPDMFISIHANSLAETTDATNVRGLTVWYRNPSSKPLAESLMSDLHSANPGTTRQASPNQSNFYVCRPPWAPSVIIEASFMNNIHDFSWLINDAKQNEFAAALSNAIMNYYR
jgi:N-acetylmuramoyl-L-alanine amidase